ncbi:MAG TPA: DUF4238 domain-containing protein [Acidobacteriaceae bacterium]|nr:DUF4238 domain-containing protein [Acidobacteriaceae bacterium]
MTLTRDNHFVPQLYLKNFASASGEVYEYRILVSHSRVPLWKPVHVAGTGYERNLYTRLVSGEDADDIEQWLNREFETPANEAIQRVLQDRELSRNDWERLARFLASQIVRTPAFLIKNLPRWNQMAPKVLEQTMRDVEERLREAKRLGQQVIIDNPSSDTEYVPIRVERKDLPEEKRVQLTTKMVVGRGLWFYSMKHLLTKTLKVLPRHNWEILEAPVGLPWFTSDDPAICLNFRSDTDYDFDGGWNRERGNILFPLSPRHLMVTEIGGTFFGRRVPSRYHARLFRRIIAQHSHRRIYSSAIEEKIPQLKPRTVDAKALQTERALWVSYYEDQSSAERAL